LSNQFQWNISDWSLWLKSCLNLEFSTMRKIQFLVSTALVLLGLILTGIHWRVTAQPTTPVTVLTSIRLIDGKNSSPRENVDLFLQGDRILAVIPNGGKSYPKNAKMINSRGKTVIPALINTHGHLGLTQGTERGPEYFTRQNVLAQLKQYEKYGVTTVLSMGTDQKLIYPLREEQKQTVVSGARVLTAGQGFGVEGGDPPTAIGASVSRPNSSQQARSQVKAMLNARPDMVKIWVDDQFQKAPKLRSDIYQAIINEAHRANLRVAAHVFYLEDAKALIAAGVDALAHSIRDRPVDVALIQAMRDKSVFLIPTLTRDESSFIYAEQPAWMKEPFFTAAVTPDVLQKFQSSEYINKIRKDPDTAKWKAAAATSKLNLKTLYDAGVQVGFGTDSGANFDRIPGFDEHRELQLMVQSGLTPMQALRCATGNTAQLLKLKDVGLLEAGKKADFLVLNANPLDDIRNTTKLAAVWRAGQPIDR
jgi:imidazolonepropionase-like amidohydrolase